MCVTIECQHVETHTDMDIKDPKSEVYCNLMPWGGCFGGVGVEGGGVRGLVGTNPKSSQKIHQEMFLNLEMLRPTFFLLARKSKLIMNNLTIK